MKKGILKTGRGFTIAEVALVIAIGGLIFLMAMLALPGLRASQRDAERREDVIFLVGKIKDYQSNNRGALPRGEASAVDGNGNSSWDDFYNSYLGTNFADPNGEQYKLEVANCGNVELSAECASTKDGGVASVNEGFPNGYKMSVVVGASCGDEGQAVRSANSRKVAVLYRLESAGAYCEDD